MDAGYVDCPGHQAIKRVNFSYEMPSTKTTYRRVTGHDTDGITLLREQTRAGANACTGCCSLDASMAATDNNDIIPFHAIYLSTCGGGVNVQLSKESLPNYRTTLTNQIIRS